MISRYAEAQPILESATTTVVSVSCNSSGTSGSLFVYFDSTENPTPVFMVFDVSPMSDGSMVNNIREVRMKGAPSMTWGYIDGTRHHLGFAKSQGMSSANKFPGYEIWMKDRCDVFIEDLSRTVLIEEIPQF